MDSKHKQKRWRVVLQVIDTPAKGGARDLDPPYVSPLTKEEIARDVVSRDLPAGLQVKVLSVAPDGMHIAKNYLVQSAAADEAQRQMWLEVASWECADCGMPLTDKTARKVMRKRKPRRACADRRGCAVRRRSIARATGTGGKRK